MLIRPIFLCSCVLVGYLHASTPVRLSLDGLLVHSPDVRMGKVVRSEVLADSQFGYETYSYSFDAYRSISGDCGIFTFTSIRRLKIGSEYLIFLRQHDEENSEAEVRYAMEVSQSRLDLSMLWLETSTLWEANVDPLSAQIEKIEKCGENEGSECQLISARELVPLPDVLRRLGRLRDIDINVSEWSQESMYSISVE